MLGDIEESHTKFAQRYDGDGEREFWPCPHLDL
jgi:hypothetical protein